jgi:exopolyphosphatase/guanosine-5'-triphosphate,3'-diphosphate pyrophosphatase
MKETLINLAALDIGSHTARLLVSRWAEGTGILKPLIRERAYIRLGKDFELGKTRSIKPEAVERTLRALDGFVRAARALGVKEILAVATGVVREADNQGRFIEALESGTGVRVRVVSGEEEAFLTGLGVGHALRLGGRSFIVFDLGGGTTEFLIEEGEERRVLSLPIGAAVSTERYLKSDPPDDEQIGRLQSEVSATLRRAFVHPKPDEKLLVGTGGTVTSLAAMIHGISVDDISPQRMDGLALGMEGLEALFQKMRRMTTHEMVHLLGVDQGRADVIIAGGVIVISLMRFFKSMRLTVSVSDLLEGILIDHVSKRLLPTGGGDEKRRV